MIPKELEKSIDEIKTPSNRILVISLLLAVIAMASVIAYLSRGNDQNLKRENEHLRTELDNKYTEILRLNKFIIDKQEEDNRFYKKREAVMDSIINVTKYLKNKLKQP